MVPHDLSRASGSQNEPQLAHGDLKSGEEAAPEQSQVELQLEHAGPQNSDGAAPVESPDEPQLEHGDPQEQGEAGQELISQEQWGPQCRGAQTRDKSSLGTAFHSLGASMLRI